jgi:capsular polysaccharide export protein
MDMSLRIIGELYGKRILLLQGPMGPFFWKFDRFCSDMGARVHRICFNGGDYFYARKKHVTNYRGAASDWEAYISHFLKKNAIDAIFVYGDCRFYHRKAIESARKLEIEVFVFEEGYIRPNYFTLEREGVNGYSKLPKNPAYYKESKPVPEKKWGAFSGRYSFHKWAIHTVVYYIFMKLLRWLYPSYEHHRNTSIFLEIIWGIQNMIRKWFFYFKEKKINRRVSRDLSNRYFLAPLQTLKDFQISTHSRFSGMENFIQTAIASFAEYAADDVYLIFKHHPLDRGRRNYTHYIRRIAKQYAVADRVLSVHDVHLPTCLKNAIGTVTINSTVGISSLFHQTPTITLGSAFYDIEGLTCQGMSLDRFWTQHKPPQQKLFQKFKSHIIDQTQIIGSFYSHFPEEWSVEKTKTWSLNTNGPKAIKVETVKRNS